MTKKKDWQRIRFFVFMMQTASSLPTSHVICKCFFVVFILCENYYLAVSAAAL
jgi:hypothetical protein